MNECLDVCLPSHSHTGSQFSDLVPIFSCLHSVKPVSTETPDFSPSVSDLFHQQYFFHPQNYSSLYVILFSHHSGKPLPCHRLHAIDYIHLTACCMICWLDNLMNTQVFMYSLIGQWAYKWSFYFYYTSTNIHLYILIITIHFLFITIYMSRMHMMYEYEMCP